MRIINRSIAYTNDPFSDEYSRGIGPFMRRLRLHAQWPAGGGPVPRMRQAHRRKCPKSSPIRELGTGQLDERHHWELRNYYAGGALSADRVLSDARYSSDTQTLASVCRRS